MEYYYATDADNIVVASPVVKIARPWGFWATLGFSIVLGMVYIFVVVVIVMGMLIMAKIQNPQLNIEEYIGQIAETGFLLSVCTVAATPICVGFMILFAALRTGWKFKEYLGLTIPRARQILVWLTVMAAFIFITEGITYLLGQSNVPDFMVNIYNTAYSLPLLFLALVIAAPILEEIFFRGFMFEGIRHSRLNVAGALVITSLVWASLHTQYGFSEIRWIFAWGIILGWARVRTGSCVLTTLMHSFVNLVGLVELMVRFHTLE